ncbi:hypothetical protein [Italian clover phyllody phytoplasma]|uniref:hypothetical protein n=1 Tax=Italian clover phyllody phytoplasma TaxID=1196420 RepID=UPI00031AA79E|nr:hypothetical protein [Italian clover phyllody phytoplasma]
MVKKQTGKFVLRKIIIISFFISMSIMLDYFQKWFLPFLTLPFGGQIFKLSFLVLFLSGFVLGFKNGLTVNCFYALFHLLKSYDYIISTKEIYRLGWFYFALTLLFDYLIYDLSVILSGLFYKNDFNQLKNKKTILISLFTVVVLRILSTSLSTYFVYFQRINPSQKNFFFWHFLYSLKEKGQAWEFCLFFSSFLFIIYYVIGSILIIFLVPKLEYVLEKYSLEKINF